MDPIEKLMFSLLNDKTLEICKLKEENSLNILLQLKYRSNRLFSGKQMLKLKDMPRWIIYAIQDIGIKTDWWTVDWENKKDIYRETRSRRLCTCCTHRYEFVSWLYKIGTATFKVNTELREIIKDSPKQNLVEMFVTNQLKALCPNDKQFKIIFQPGIIKIVINMFLNN